MSTKHVEENKSELLKFEKIYQDIKQTNIIKLKLYNQWRYNREWNKLHNQIVKLCNHDWVIDRYDFDPCRTCYICNKCGENR